MSLRQRRKARQQKRRMKQLRTKISQENCNFVGENRLVMDAHNRRYPQKNQRYIPHNPVSEGENEKINANDVTMVPGNDDFKVPRSKVLSWSKSILSKCCNEM